MASDRRVQRFLTAAYNEVLKGHGPSHGPTLILAQANIYDAFVQELHHFERLSEQAQPPVDVRTLLFKTTTVYRLSQPGWTVRMFQATKLKEATMKSDFGDKLSKPLTTGGGAEEPMPEGESYPSKQALREQAHQQTLSPTKNGVDSFWDSQTAPYNPAVEALNRKINALREQQIQCARHTDFLRDEASRLDREIFRLQQLRSDLS